MTAVAARATSRSQRTIVPALAVVYVAWGSTYVAMRVGVRDLPPLIMSGARFLLAGAALYAWCAWQRRRQHWPAPTGAQWRASVILGLALPAAGTGGATWAEQQLPAGTTALLLATIPIWIIVMGRIVDGTAISASTAAGLVLGVLGVGVLVNPFAGGSADLVASAVALGGALCWGVGSVYAGHAARPEQPHLGSGMEMISAGLALGVIGIVAGEPRRVHPDALTSGSAVAFCYLVVVGSLLAYSCYEWLLEHAPGRIVATYAFVNPVVAVLLGWWLLGEHLTVRALIATCVIVAGVALVIVSSNADQPEQD